MTLEQLQDKLLPILFYDNDKLEDVNRANILYNRVTDQVTIKRTKFDKYSNPDIITWNCLFDILEINCRQISYKWIKNKNSSQLVFTISKASSIIRSLDTIEDILVKCTDLPS